MNSVERAEEYVKLEPEAATHVPDRDVENWPSQGKISFRNVCMRYRAGLPNVLNGTSFEIKGGEKCGIVGRTGSGKSSIIVALFRLSELSGGSIVIDGQNIAEMGLELLRKSVSIVPQDPVLFATSIRSNLDPFSVHSDDSVSGACCATRWLTTSCIHIHYRSCGCSSWSEWIQPWRR
jgi:ABC-type multidrug transport system fused ATPase/permease subunit